MIKRRTDPPCRHCTEREEGGRCHITCQKFLDWKAEDSAILDAVKKKAMDNRKVAEYISDTKWRMHKNREKGYKPR